MHTYRGAKDIEIKIGNQVFKEVIKRATGEMTNPEDCCHFIWFTEDEEIASIIDRDDWANKLVFRDDF